MKLSEQMLLITVVWSHVDVFQHAIPAWDARREGHVSGDVQSPPVPETVPRPSLPIPTSSIDSPLEPGNPEVSRASEAEGAVVASRGQGNKQGSAKHVHPVWDLLAGSAAGATAVVLTYPLDLVRTRMAWSSGLTVSPPVTSSSRTSSEHAAASPAGAFSSSAGGALSPSSSPSGRFLTASASGTPPTIRSELAKTLREGGVVGLYRGMSPTLMGILPYAGLKWV